MRNIKQRLRPASRLVLAALFLVTLILGITPSGYAQTAARFIYTDKRPAPSLEGGAEWLNVAGPLDLADLRGKFVLLDFWTYCCINCMHILPELKKLEQAHPHNLVVVGVHSGKFENERDSANIREAILRYEIEHPVVSDPDYVLWNRFGVDTWPTLFLIDPEGNLIGGLKGETDFAQLDGVLRKSLGAYKRKGVLDETPLEFNFERHAAPSSALSFPGKLLADAESQRLYIADSNHNRIVIATLEGDLVAVVGSGAVGRQDGSYDEATFNRPQGLALRGEILYVADTENHLLRKVDLRSRQVSTIAGLGRQRRERNTSVRRSLGPPGKIALNSPWALCIAGQDLYIAMAGPHQIWRMALDESEIGVHAGNGREDIIDGPLLPRNSRAPGTASFAQPSGLATDGEWLFVADSEGSSIRAVPLATDGNVVTLIGTSHLPARRLFTFGDIDGVSPNALLQHPLDVAWHEGVVYVADTYNNKIKALNAATRTVMTVAGGLDLEATPVATNLEQTGNQAAPPVGIFDEPGGISVAGSKLYVADTNNHRIRVIDLANNDPVRTLSIRGLEPPALPSPKKASLPNAKHVRLMETEVRPSARSLLLDVALALPLGAKINELAPMQYTVEAGQSQGPVDRKALAVPVKLPQPGAEFQIHLPLAKLEGEETLEVSLTYYFCQESGLGLCKVGNVVWSIPIRLSSEAKATRVELRHRIE